CEVSEDDCQRDERHQRTNAAASLYDFQLLRLMRAAWHQLDDVALSQDRNIKEVHRPDGTARGKELKRESDLVKENGRNRERQIQQQEWHEQEPQQSPAPEVNDDARQHEHERETLNI